MPHSWATQPSATRSRVLKACTAYRWDPNCSAAEARPSRKKDYSTADRVRHKILSLGFEVEDTPEGPKPRPRAR